jgi:hypothetical protein
MHQQHHHQQEPAYSPPLRLPAPAYTDNATYSAAATATVAAKMVYGSNFHPHTNRCAGGRPDGKYQISHIPRPKNLRAQNAPKCPSA